MKILITLCARAGSKGIPGKNTKQLNGIPLIQYSINCAKSFAKKFNSKIAISTDDDLVLDICKSEGIETKYKRPFFLSTDNASKIETIFDLLKYEEVIAGFKYDYILDLDISSPLRSLNDLLDAFNKLKNDQNALNIFSVSKAHKNPYFNMVEQKEDGYFELSKCGNFVTRQSAKEVYELNASFYFYRRSFFENQNMKVINDKSLIYLMKHICFDLDEPIDFDFMNYLIQSNKLEIKF